MNRKEAYQLGLQKLQEAGFPEAKSDVLFLLEGLFHFGMTELLAHGDMELSEEEKDCYLDAIRKRLRNIPVQYITGTQIFMGLPFIVNENVLIPRQDTEVLVEEVLKYLHDGFSILDICTGSGCIALSLLQYSNHCEMTAVDLSLKALEVAKKNAELLGKRVNWIHSDLFENVSGKFDIIVSNPPYISSDVIPTLMPDVREHEPIMALDGHKDGLFFYRKIVHESKNYLLRGGMLFFEIGYDQGKSVALLLKEAGFKDIKIIQDYAGLDRVVMGVAY